MEHKLGKPVPPENLECLSGYGLSFLRNSRRCLFFLRNWESPPGKRPPARIYHRRALSNELLLSAVTGPVFSPNGRERSVPARTLGSRETIFALRGGHASDGLARE